MSTNNSLICTWLTVLLVYFFRVSQKETLTFGWIVSSVNYNLHEDLSRHLIPFTIQINGNENFLDLLSRVKIKINEINHYNVFGDNSVFQGRLPVKIEDVQIVFSESELSEFVMSGFSSEKIFYKYSAESIEEILFNISSKAMGLFERHIIHIIDEIIDCVDLPIKLISIVPGQEESIISAANNTTKVLSSNNYLHQTLLNSIVTDLNKVAVIQGEVNLTYKQLINLSQYYALKIVNDFQIKPGSRIAILMAKGWEQIVACYAVSLAGCVFVPVNISDASQRIINILEDADVSLILMQPIENILIPKKYPKLCVDKGIESNNVNFEFKETKTPSDPAYIIYTSGTTGKPKGVVISHKNALNTILDINMRFSVTSSFTVLALSELSFDLAIYDIFGLLCAGGTVVLPSALKEKSPQEWLQLIRKYQVNLWNSVPAYFELLAEFCEQSNLQFPESLQLILLSGDWISLSLTAQIKAQLPMAKLVSLGGATEASIWSIYYEIKKVKSEWKSVPYGKPLANQYFYILDKSLQKLPIGVVGAIYIAGDGVGLGYLNDSEKSSQHFIRYQASGQEIYKTGDMGYYDSEGNIIFIGRVDNQVKINGFRIEIGEIENCLNSFNAIDKAIVTIQQSSHHKGLSLIVAHIVINIITIDVEKLKKHINDNLPVYMHPHHFRIIKNLPLNINGKLDRVKLNLNFGNVLDFSKQHDKTVQSTARKNALHHDLIVRQLIRAVAIELSLDEKDINAHNNFFDLGGDSISSLRLIGRLGQQGYHIDFNDVIELKTFTELAGCVKLDSSGSANKILEINGDIDLKKDKKNHENYVITNEQEGILFQCQYFNHPELYIGQVVASFSGIFNVSLFSNVFKKIINHNPILRMGFLIDEEVNVFVKSANDIEYSYVVHKLKTKSTEEFCGLERKLGVDISEPPLIRCLLLIDEKDITSEVILTFHHVLLDGVSCINLLYLLFNEYSNAIEGLKVMDSDCVKMNFTSVMPQDLAVDEQRSYWLHLLKEHVPQTKYYPNAEKLCFSSKSFLIEKNISNELKKSGHNSSVSIHELLIMLWGLTLGEYYQTHRVCFGMVISTRSALEKNLGFFIKTPPVFINVSGEIEGILYQVKEQLHNLFQYGEVSLSDIRRWTECPYDKYLFDSVFIIDSYTKNRSKLPTLKSLITLGYTHYPLVATISEWEDGYKLKLDYHANIFLGDEIDRIGELFLLAINKIINRFSGVVSNSGGVNV